ncbi:MFS transporter, partial [Kineococcus glutinatus]|uniref:MFS transporter n=1 Tax=Kineococcus glutinatus TaxID=1070872 RepID=UPI0031E71EE6
MLPDTSDASETAPAAPGLLSPRYRALTLGIVVLVVTAAFEAMAVATVMPVVSASLGGVELYALAFAAPLATNVLGVVAGGLDSDAAGPRRPVAVGLVLFVAGLLTAALAPSMAVLAVGRAVQGLGAGLFVVTLNVVVARAYPEELRPRVFAAEAAAWVLPGVVGPALAGAVAEQVGWRWVFAGPPVLAVLAPVVVLRRLPAGPVPG